MTTKIAMELFDPDCSRCPRIGTFLAETRERHPHYHNRPVAPFGACKPKLLVVGLAPGLHGANATGRPFTGDHAGLLLYKTLFGHGFANHPTGSDPKDGLQLKNCRITNAVKCVPPANKPIMAEIRTCNSFLRAELHSLSSVRVILALGRIAHDAVLLALNHSRSAASFGHGAEHVLTPTLTLIDSYHCSRYNTQTGRLTDVMFSALFQRIVQLLDG